MTWALLKAASLMLGRPCWLAVLQPSGPRLGVTTITLKARRAPAPKAVGVERVLPAEKLLLRELVVTAGCLESNFAGSDCDHYRGLAAGHPPYGVRRRQLSVHGLTFPSQTKLFSFCSLLP